jgi:hypothetical protein
MIASGHTITKQVNRVNHELTYVSSLPKDRICILRKVLLLKIKSNSSSFKLALK